MENVVRRRAAGVAIAAALALVAFVGASTGRAEDARRLRAEADGLAGSEQQALLRLYAAETAATRTRDRSGALASEVVTLEAQVRSTRHYREIARTSLSASQSRVARVLRLLYVNGPPADPLALILGAQSFDEAIDAVDALRFAVVQNRELAEEAARKGRALRAATARLDRRVTALRASRDEAAQAARALTLVASDRARYVASLRARRVLTEQRLAALEAEATAAARRTEALQAAAAAQADDPVRVAPAPTPAETIAEAVAVTPAAGPEPLPAPPAPAASPATGPRQLVVRATAYSLPGRTASGLPVGPGIIAVDPSVIPLGTRVNVPGYGEAVAADTGSAVQGAIIDVWLPTLEQARAWGLKTVTITIYRS